MPSRSWMAALALAAGLAAGGAPARAEDDPVVNTVNLELRIAGLGRDGCEIEVRPAHAGCKFAPVRRRVERGVSSGIAKLPPIAIVAESTSPDRDCVFAITLKEPSRTTTTTRGIRLEPPTAGRPTPVRSFTCYLTTPSLAAKVAPGRSRR